MFIEVTDHLNKDTFNLNTNSIYVFNSVRVHNKFRIKVLTLKGEVYFYGQEHETLEESKSNEKELKAILKVGV